MIKHAGNNNKGFTLIEGLVALAILAIFIPLFYSLNSYINRSFSIANRQSDLQFYSRLAEIKIKNEIKSVNNLDILSSEPDASNFFDTEKAIYVNNDKKIVIKTVNADNEIIETPLFNVPDDVKMYLAFNKIIDEGAEGDNVYGEKLLGYTITCSSSGDIVSLDSSLLLRDAATDGDPKNLRIDGESGIAIIYN